MRVGDLRRPQARVELQDPHVRRDGLGRGAPLDVQPRGRRERGDALAGVVVERRGALVVRDGVGHARHAHERLREEDVAVGRLLGVDGALVERGGRVEGAVGEELLGAHDEGLAALPEVARVDVEGQRREERHEEEGEDALAVEKERRRRRELLLLLVAGRRPLLVRAVRRLGVAGHGRPRRPGRRRLRPGPARGACGHKVPGCMCTVTLKRLRTRGGTRAAPRRRAAWGSWRTLLVDCVLRRKTET